MTVHTRSVFVAVLAIVILSCSERTRESDRAALDAQRENILALAASGLCASDSQCDFIALGAKPCGGPWEYIVYSTAIDTIKLFAMVNRYYQDEDAYNRRWGIASTCDVTPPPDSVGCLDGVCVKYRRGSPY